MSVKRNSFVLIGFLLVLLCGVMQNFFDSNEAQWWCYDFSMKFSCLFAAIWIFILVPYDRYIEKGISYFFLIDRSKEVLDQILVADRYDGASNAIQAATLIIISLYIIFRRNKHGEFGYSYG